MIDVEIFLQLQPLTHCEQSLSQSYKNFLPPRDCILQRKHEDVRVCTAEDAQSVCESLAPRALRKACVISLSFYRCLQWHTVWLCSVSDCSCVVNSLSAWSSVYSCIKIIIAPCIMEFIYYSSPTYALLLNLEKFKIYIKRRINIAPTCFGLRPSSGSLYRAWLKLYFC